MIGGLVNKMVSKEDKKLLIGTFIIIISMIIFFILISYGTKEVSIEGEYTYCKDKDGKIIEGLICKEIETRFFGEHESFVLFAFIPLILCLLIVYRVNLKSIKEVLK